MTRPNDYRDDMSNRDHTLHARRSFTLDAHTADRMLGAGLAVDDAPPMFQGVAATVQALRAPVTTTELQSEEQGIACFLHGLADEQRDSAARPVRTRRRGTRRLQLAAAAIMAGTTLMCGLAAAGALPGAAQDVARDMLDSVGIAVPGPDIHAGTHPGERGRSSDQPTSPNSSKSSGDNDSDHGPGTGLPDVDKGASVSSGAGNGKSQAGEQGSDGANAPVDVPNSGGTGTSDDASGGNSELGTQTADSQSDGRSSDGSENADGRSSDGSENATGGLQHAP